MLRVISALIVSVVAVTTVGPPGASALSSGNITGTVYQDINADGSVDAATTVNIADPGIGGVTVRGYDSTGSLVGTATTASNGTYTLAISGAATTAIRVEFDTPAGYVESASFAPVTGSNNSSRPTAIQFTVVPDTGVNYSVMKPDEYALGTTDKIAGITHQKGPTTYNSSLDTIMMTTMGLAAPTTDLANWGETGTLWGLGWQRNTQRLWAAAAIRRGSGLGPKGIGGLYVTDITGDTTSNVITSFDLVADKGLVLSAGTDYSNSARGLSGTDETAYVDTPGFSGVGLEGIGDIDLSKDDHYLYLVNLYQRKIHRFTVGGTADAPTLSAMVEYQVPDSYCTSPDIARPWGIEVTEAGVVNAGVVCTTMSTGANVSISNRTGGGRVLRLDPSTGAWSQLTTINLDYMRLTDWSYSPAVIPLRDTAKYWHDWTNEWPSIWGLMSAGNTNRNVAYTQPMITDIETVKNGDLVIGITDRFNYQWTNQIVSPDSGDSTRYLNNFATGDTTYMCKTASGYAQDSESTCKSDVDFIDDNWSGTCFGTTCNHYETALGALAAYPPNVGLKFAKTAFDAGTFNHNGVNVNTISNGAVANGAALFNDQTFGKQDAMADIELLMARAPISIGNRLWFDADKDGLQDPGELPVVGVLVRLYDSSGTLVGTAKTNANGEYYFTSLTTEAANGGTTPDYQGGGITADEEYTIRVDNATDFSTGVLKGYAPTLIDKTSSATALDDSIDSDATLVASYPRITVPAMSWGTTNYDFDIGFVPKVSVGDRVWVDMDRDKVQDVGETGLAGVTVTITKSDGSPVYDVMGNLVTTAVTDANGNYLFDNLPAAPDGTYKVSMAPPTGYAMTTATFLTSAGITTAGSSDLRLDYGVVPVVSVGDRVWFDTNRNGIQDAGDTGIAGVTLTITTSAGGAVTDVYGNAVTTTVTDANGNYSFTNLPYGTYKVTVTTPNGLTATLTGQGTTATDSSTGYATSVALNTPGQSDTTLDFGFYEAKVSVGNFVWFDADADNVQDPGELGIAGVTLRITKPDGSAVTDIYGNAVTTTVTDANGMYLFENLPYGSYKVTVVSSPTGLTPSSGNAASGSNGGEKTSSNLTTALSSDLSLDFGFYAPRVSVGDLVWFDTDHDGVQDFGEPGMAGIVMTITTSTGGAVTDVYGNAVTTTVTDADGKYSFDNLPVGQYKVTVGAVPSTLVATVEGAGTTATDSSKTYALSATLTNNGDRDSSLDFGFWAPPASVGSRVWSDTDNDGIQDAGEPGIAGVVLRLTNIDGSAVTDIDGNAVTTTTTDANGNYLFANLPVGVAYKVTVVTAPTGYITSPAGVGSDREVDSSTGTATSTVMSPSNLTDFSLDFGFAPVVSVGNFVWRDSDRDGVQDLGEPGIAGVTLTIKKADGTSVTDINGNAVTTTTTDSTGHYSFTNLPIGQYTVTVTTPAGSSPTSAGVGSSSTDSSTGSATSTNLLTGGASDMSLDFGFVVPRVSVGNFVWFDTDRDGVQDGGEPGISGAVVTITKVDGSAVTDIDGITVTTTTTDSTGHYLFENLPLGQYTVTVTTPTGMTSTVSGSGTTSTDSSSGNATSANLAADGASDLTLDFGFVDLPVSVGNLVWNDWNRDGIQDVGEPGIAGVTVTITKADGTAVTDIHGNSVTTTTTDANGHYLFDDLPLGQYKVTVTAPTGYTATLSGRGTSSTDSSTGSATSTNLTVGGTSDTTLDFGFYEPKVSVGDFVWVDADRDGIQDAGESGIAGVTVSITKADGTAVTDIFGNAVTSTTTDADGHYLFDNLPLGQYKVTVTTPSGYAATVSGAGSDATKDSSTTYATSSNLTTDGASDTTLDFGFVVPKVSVGNFVWKDADRDGIQDVGEAGIAGVTVSITKADGTAVTDIFGAAVTSTTTDANGNYLFDNLPVGQYKVTVTTPSGCAATVSGAGSDATKDSSTTNATSSNLTTNNASDLSLDFGFVDLPVSVGNFVWHDLDRDGVQDAGEPGIAGVTVTITKADGTAVTDIHGNSVTTTTTDANGHYLFDDLPLGQYKVTVSTPAGYIATVSGAGSAATDSSTGNATSSNLTVGGQSDLTLDFGFVRPRVSVGDYVWFDTDKDGVQDAGESGIAGVTLTITKADGTAVTDIFGNSVTTTTTDANGHYVFDNLPFGSYKVTVTPPAGYTATLTGQGTTSTDSSTGNATSTNLGTDGASDMSLDFGFFTPKVSVGNLVWNDIDRDGVQDAGEPGIAGAVLTITKMDGSAVTDVFGNSVGNITTGNDGRYLFENLPTGQYKVSVTTPAAYAPTTTGAGTTGTDSATGSDTSLNLTTDGASDLTLDFGFFPVAVSVGDLVWKDLDGDGIQDVGEPGIAGVVLSIKQADGTAVTDINGLAVTTTTTDKDGKYSFDNLPPGTYIVTVTAPAGLVATKPGVGSPAADSSTGTATSTDLSSDGQRDSTLDFGFRELPVETTTTTVPPTTIPATTTTVTPTAVTSTTTTTVHATGKVSPPATPDREYTAAKNASVYLNPVHYTTPSAGSKVLDSTMVLGDGVTWKKVVTTKDGTWVVIGRNVRFTPQKDFVGIATMPYRVQDSSGQWANAVLKITVLDSNVLPATGSDIRVLLKVAVLLLAVGSLFCVVRKRRRPA